LRKKAIWVFFLSLLLLVGNSLPAAWAEGTTAGPVAGKAEVVVSEEFTVGVVVYAVYGLVGATLELAFDPQKLAVLDQDDQTPGTQISAGDIFAENEVFVGPNEADNTAGRISYTVMFMDPAAVFNGSGTLANLKFKALAPGTTELKFKEDSNLAPHGLVLATSNAPPNDKIPVNPFAAEVKIISPAVKGNVWLEKVNPQDTNHSGIMVTAKSGDSVVATTYSAEDGSYSFNDLPAGSYTFEYLKKGWSKVIHTGINVPAGAIITLPDLTLFIGDMNSDTFINVQDLLWVAQYIGKRPTDPEWPEAQIADVNQDTYINVQDLLRVAANIGKRPV